MYRSAKIQKLIQLVTLMVIMLSFQYADILATSSLIVGLSLILFIGIPHGANDHLIFFRLFESAKGEKSYSSFLFYGSYLGLMLLYGLLWFFLSFLSLVVFILISIYHFGQSNLIGNDIKSRPVHFTTLFLSGTFVLITPILTHIETAIPVIQSLVNTFEIDLNQIQFLKKLGLIIGFTMGFYWIILITFKYITPAEGINEIINWLLLFALFVYTPLWICFSVYFSIWHAIPSMIDQMNFFKTGNQNYKLKNFLIQILPYSLVALFGFFISLGFSDRFITENQGIALLFAFIAIITLPHMLMMEFMYQKIKPSDGFKDNF